MENKGSTQASNRVDDLVDDIVRKAVPMDKVWASNNDNHQPVLDEILANSSEIRTVADEILANAKDIPYLALNPNDLHAPERVIAARPTEQELGLFPSEPVNLPPLKLVEYKNLHTGKTTSLANYLLAGGDINAKNSDGQSPIEVAVAVGSPRDVRVILEAPGFDPRGIDISELARIQKAYGDLQDYRELEPLLVKFEAMKVAIEADPAKIKGPVNTIPADFDPKAGLLDISAIQERAGSAGVKFQQNTINEWMALDNPRPAAKAQESDGPSR